MNDHSDVIIAGGGLAGLTLALQLKDKRPELDITVIERQPHPLPEAAHKVGESSVEIGAHYFADDLGLRDMLKERQLPKYGLRFFFGGDRVDDIADMDELGGSELLPVSSFQLDRGRLENDLGELVADRGIRFLHSHKVTAMEVDGDDVHRLTVRDSENGEVHQMSSRWLIDASSRASVLKRTLDLEKPNNHHCHAVWFRLNCQIKIDQWSEDSPWQSRGPDGQRWLSTNHFMGPGYWVWFIPLASDTISVGIVADPDLHPLDTMKDYDTSMEWLAEHQPVCHAKILEAQTEVLDFKFLRHYSHDVKRVYSADRWALTGEAGLFLDPFYSPGSDFIGISNTFITDLIDREMAGEDIRLRAARYQQLYFSFYNSTLSLYENQYPGFGHRDLMAAKITWDYAYYWGVLALIFCQDAITDLELYDELQTELAEAQRLNREVQVRFRQIGAEQSVQPPNGCYFNQCRMPLMVDLNGELDDQLTRDELIERLHRNFRMLDELAPQMMAFAGGEMSEGDDWANAQLGLRYREEDVARVASIA